MFSSVIEARKTINGLKEALQRDDGCVDFEVFRLIEVLNRVFDVIVAVNKRQRQLTPAEITAAGAQGLSLTEQLIERLRENNLMSHKQEVENVAMFLANWVIKHKGELVNIRPVVDGLADIANAVEDKVSLLQLNTFMGQVAHACSNDIQHDLQNSDPNRPWLILNLDRGIVATRTLDVEIMRAVFDELVKAIPLAAPEFFRQGMDEMLEQDYPEPVREVMEEYYEKTKPPVVH